MSVFGKCSVHLHMTCEDRKTLFWRLSFFFRLFSALSNDEPDVVKQFRHQQQAPEWNP